MGVRTSTAKAIDSRIPPKQANKFIGHVSGLLTVRGYAGTRNGSEYVICYCQCGKPDHLVLLSTLRYQVSKSCGCLRDRQAVLNQKNKTHGLSNTKVYRQWRDMHTRCENPNFMHYKYYGGRGIKVCPEWTGPGGFDKFIKEIGWPSNEKMTIERRDNDLGYFLENCYWMPGKDQAKHRRSCWKILVDGKEMTARDAAFSIGKHDDYLASKLRKIKPNKYQPVTLEELLR